MKSNTLLTQLQKVLPLAQGNKVIPITSCIKFDGDKTFTATDTLNEISITLENSGLSTPFCVDAVKFTNILRGYGDKEVSFKLTDTTIEIKSDKSKYKLPIEASKDFPEINAEFKESKDIDSLELQNAIKATSFATSTDDLRPAMNGIYFNDKEVASTDAHKLVRYDFNHGFNFILPVTSFNLISANLSGECKISETESHVKFEMGNATLISRKIDERFPDYNAVIPVGNQNKLTINPRKLEDVVKRLLLTADANTSAIVLDLSSECKAYSSDVNQSTEGLEQLECQYNGDDLKIGFNGKFLLDCLRSITDSEVVLELSQPNRAGLFNCKNKIVLLMPVMV